ncbi:hypothetical protein [Allorhizocola rhizosphaerae]|uniref:hypothetical protein n=1 Tax=Allorhizocola rhizosphaerae TaxID=1872709 RepID=UPI0013C2CDA3|nr:hypothetical protein [Allorhizocola rhizosphaerae]
MLTPAWYLTDGDYFGELPKVAQMDTVEAAISAIAQLFSDEGEFSPTQTAAATYMALLAAEHLNDEMTYNARRHSLIELAQLAHGLNLLLAHLTQTIQKLAEHADKRTFPGLADLPTETVKTVIDSLCAAGASGEVCAGRLKEAHLTLRSAAK